MPTSILIGQQNSSGAFISKGALSFQQANTKLRVTDVNEQSTDFDIPESGLLCFEVAVTSGEGGGQDYTLVEIEEMTGETASSEIKEGLSLKVKLTEKASPAGLLLEFIGDEDQDVLRTLMRLSHSGEFGLQRTTNSVVLKAFIPAEE